MSHACQRQHVGEIKRREQLREPSRFDWGKPCEVRIKNRTSFSASIPLAAGLTAASTNAHRWNSVTQFSVRSRSCDEPGRDLLFLMTTLPF